MYVQGESLKMCATFLTLGFQTPRHHGEGLMLSENTASSDIANEITEVASNPPCIRIIQHWVVILLVTADILGYWQNWAITESQPPTTLVALFMVMSSILTYRAVGEAFALANKFTTRLKRTVFRYLIASLAVYSANTVTILIYAQEYFEKVPIQYFLAFSGVMLLATIILMPLLLCSLAQLLRFVAQRYYSCEHFAVEVIKCKEMPLKFLDYLENPSFSRTVLLTFAVGLLICFNQRSILEEPFLNNIDSINLSIDMGYILGAMLLQWVAGCVISLLIRFYQFVNRHRQINSMAEKFRTLWVQCTVWCSLLFAILALM